MKKIFFLTMFALSVMGCSKKENSDVPVRIYEETEMDKLRKELGIPNDLENERGVHFLDGSGRIFLVGKKGNELYFYNFDAYNKKIIAQHKEVLPEKIEVILDNGDKKIFEGKDYCPSIVSEFCKNDKDNIFLGTIYLEKYPEYRYVATKLYIFDKKFKFLDNITYDYSFFHFYPLCVRRINELGYLLNNGPRTYVYDFDCNFLYQYEYTKSPNIGEEIFYNGEPITAEEFIIINYKDIKRVNLKEDKLIWSINKYKALLI